MKNLNKELDKLKKDDFIKMSNKGLKILIVHYACSNISHSPIRISSISTYDINSDIAKTFGRNSQSDELEVKLLKDFFSYVRNKLEDKYYILGFNNKSEKYGITSLRNRYIELTNDKDIAKITNKQIIDLDRLIKSSFPNYFGGLKRLIEINEIEICDFISGFEELNLFKEGSFEKLNKSTKTKVLALNKIYKKYISNNLENFSEYVMSFENKDFYKNFIKHISQIKKIINIKNVKIDNPKDEAFLRKLIYVNVITSMETYLADAFIHLINENEVYLKKFVESHNNFNKKDFLKVIAKNYVNYENHSLKDILLNESQVVLNNISFHNISNVETLYKNVLDLSFPKGFGNLYQSINIRHHLVHRNGKDENGENIPVSYDSLTDLIITVENFVGQINDLIFILEGK